MALSSCLFPKSTGLGLLSQAGPGRASQGCLLDPGCCFAALTSSWGHPLHTSRAAPRQPCSRQRRASGDSWLGQGDPASGVGRRRGDVKGWLGRGACPPHGCKNQLQHLSWRVPSRPVCNFASLSLCARLTQRIQMRLHVAGAVLSLAVALSRAWSIFLSARSAN